MFKVLGLMSGTSLDGLDLAYCHLWEEGQNWKFSIEKTKEIGYGSKMRNRLKNAIHLTDEAHRQLHDEYGVWLGEQVKSFLKEAHLEVDFVASHGHTSHHRPEDGFTFQLGNGQLLADNCGKKVVCDFRTKDVSLGGQGAPLVPIGDSLLFHQYDFCLNLGGISNISLEKDGKRIAYDIGMANMPLNFVTEKIGLAYDENGNLARSGSQNSELLNQLNALEYYQLPHPKSTGYEWFSEKVVPLIEDTKASHRDLLHTLIHHNCEQIAKEVHQHATGKFQEILVTGGGALNAFFIEVLQEKLGPKIKVTTPSRTLIAYKEALVFALMGVLRVQDKTNVLSSVTGSSEDSCSGIIFYPQH
ncbi:anhydro-N-acetylmuramic acid kinase [Flagellimonas myxillae]|uniref:anhydro-N-acetylmuramic acid kinase n=1 Tax=Flagellimonas myxillae TaxID=2942214 RepID=UPI0029E80CC2|nr:anhydro-N-acetylmuramic acid kinase [Muricauda myxillae]